MCLHTAMNEHPLQVSIVDVVPLGHRLLLSVRGLGRRPDLPADGVIVQTGERLRLLDQPDSPGMWLLSQVTLLAGPVGDANWRDWNWRQWAGKTLAIYGVEED